MPRPVIRQVIAATYHQVWWPATDTVVYDGDDLPVWDERARTYLDPATGEVLPTWDDALDAISPGDPPRHVARFGAKFDAQGVLAGSKDASRCIWYMTKYLTKQVADCHTPDTDAQRIHMDRLAEALRYEPCSPRCANWLRHGIQPKNARPGLAPGACKGKGHRPAAGVPDVRVHDLRHTAASLWLAAGADPKVVQRALGRATAAMTRTCMGTWWMPACGRPPGSSGAPRGI